jgi:hypothetical protein
MPTDPDAPLPHQGAFEKSDIAQAGLAELLIAEDAVAEGLRLSKGRGGRFSVSWKAHLPLLVRLALWICTDIGSLALLRNVGLVNTHMSEQFFLF